MISITFHDEESVKKNFPDYEADCLVDIFGNENEVEEILCSFENVFTDFWGHGTKKKHHVYVMVKDFSHYMDLVIIINNYFNSRENT